MPLIAAALLVIAAIIYGAVALYTTVTPQFGQVAGIAAVLLAALFIALAAATLIRRYRATHGVAANGERVLALTSAWGRIRVDAVQKRGELDVHGQTADFIFADITSAQAVAQEKAWTLELRLEHNDPALWTIPMDNRKQARRWEKILTLAATQEL